MKIGQSRAAWKTAKPKPTRTPPEHVSHRTAQAILLCARKSFRGAASAMSESQSQPMEDGLNEKPYTDNDGGAADETE